MELFVSDDKQFKSLFLDIFSSYLNLIERKIITIAKISPLAKDALKLGDMPCLITQTGEVICDTELGIAQVLARSSGFYELIFGRTKEEHDMHEDFIRHLRQDLKFEFHPTMAFLNQHLLTYTYCNNLYNVTISDLYSYAILAPGLKLLKDQEKYHYSNVIRWAYHLQNLKGIKNVSKDRKLRFKLPYEPLIINANNSMIIKKATEEVQKIEESSMLPVTNSSQTSVPVQTSTIPEDKQPPKDKKAEKEKKKTEKSKQQTVPEKDVHVASKLDIRVGKVLSIAENPQGDKLYNEEIDIGNGEIRKIASGLRGRIPMNDLKDSLVVVICNLEPRNLKGWQSHGMILCATDAEGKIEFLKPPEDSIPGDEVFIGDLPRVPSIEKKCPWNNVCPDLLVNENKEATYKKTLIWKTAKGPIKTLNLVNAKIS